MRRRRVKISGVEDSDGRGVGLHVHDDLLGNYPKMWSLLLAVLYGVLQFGYFLRGIKANRFSVPI